ncbi:MAG: redox-sensing transcriptional repressor Rex [Blastocatellia bacterium]|nr:redox-sensing transcriptional repressor Rex [Blastocatellia bacterium]
MKVEKISELTIDRLSIYLRCLELLSKEGVETISSQDLATRFNLNSAQIRKDLTQFGEFGVRGVGYAVVKLRDCLRAILGLEVSHNIGIIGAGNMGIALADYEGFTGSNFKAVALFDNDQEKIGRKTKLGIEIYDVKNLKDIIKEKFIDIIVLAVPASVIQLVLDQVVAAGIKGVLSFAPVQLQVPEDVTVKIVDLTISFHSLSHALINSGIRPNNRGVKADEEEKNLVVICKEQERSS